MVRVEFTPDFAEYRWFVAISYWRLLRWPAIAVAAATIFSVVAITTGEVAISFKQAVPFVGAPAFLFVWLPLMIRGSTRRRWMSSQELRASRAYELDDSGVRCTGSAFKSEFGWSLVRRVQPVAGHVALELGQWKFHIIPDRAITPDQRVELSELFRRHVPGFEQLNWSQGRQ